MGILAHLVSSILPKWVEHSLFAADGIAAGGACAVLSPFLMQAGKSNEAGVIATEVAPCITTLVFAGLHAMMSHMTKSGRRPGDEEGVWIGPTAPPLLSSFDPHDGASYQVNGKSAEAAG